MDRLCPSPATPATGSRDLEAVGAAEPYASALRGMPGSWYFAGPQATVASLEGAGFVEARAGLETADTPFESRDEAVEFLSTVVLRHHLERLDPGLREAFSRAVADRLAASDPDGRVVLDYVRLNLEAVRPAGEPA